MLSVASRYLNITQRKPIATTHELRESALTIDAGAKELCAGLSEQQLCWRPGLTSWSIAENLAHLRATTEVFLPAVDSALEASVAMGLQTDEPSKLGPLGRLIVWRMDARPIIKMRAPKVLKPYVSADALRELERFLTSQAQFRLRIDQAAGLNLTAWRFSSPIVSHFRINLLEFFCAFNAHSRRHLWQATRVRRQIAFCSRDNGA